jgi:hypothetical protein
MFHCSYRCTKPSTAINDFSARYPGFQPDNTETLDEEFNRLSIHNGWSKKSKKHSKRRAEFYAAEFAAYYGTDGTKLQGWQALCEEVGIVPAPLSITQCKKVISCLPRFFSEQ